MPTLGSIVGLGVVAAAVVLAFVVHLQHRRKVRKLEERVEALSEEADLVSAVRERLTLPVAPPAPPPTQYVSKRARERWPGPVAVVAAAAGASSAWARRHKTGIMSVATALAVGLAGWGLGQRHAPDQAGPEPTGTPRSSSSASPTTTSTSTPAPTGTPSANVQPTRTVIPPARTTSAKTQPATGGPTSQAPPRPKPPARWQSPTTASHPATTPPASTSTSLQRTRHCLAKVGADDVRARLRCSSARG